MRFGSIQTVPMPGKPCEAKCLIKIRVLFKQYSLLLTIFCDTMCNEQESLGILQGDILKDTVL